MVSLSMIGLQDSGWSGLQIVRGTGFPFPKDTEYIQGRASSAGCETEIFVDEIESCIYLFVAPEDTTFGKLGTLIP